jgi:RHS repeat-associated protein
MLTPDSLRSAPHPSPIRFPIPDARYPIPRKCPGNPPRKPYNHANHAASLKLADCAENVSAMRQLSEKPRQGFETRKTASKPGRGAATSKVTLGLRATVVENGVRETYSARYYNPATGRFMSRDPLDGKSSDPNSLHKYLYAGGDPFRDGSEEHGFVLPGQLLPLSEN